MITISTDSAYVAKVLIDVASIFSDDDSEFFRDDVIASLCTLMSHVVGIDTWPGGLGPKEIHDLELLSAQLQQTVIAISRMLNKDAAP